MEMNLKMNILEMATHYTEVLVEKLSERYGFDKADALAYIRSDAALEPLEAEAAVEATTGRGRPEKKVKKVVNKSEMVEETIAAVLAEPAVSAEVIAEKPKKKVTPKKKAEAPVITEEKKEEVVVAEVVEEKPKKKVTPKKKADAPVVVEEKKEEEKPKKKVAEKKKAVVESLVAEAVVAAPPKAVVVAPPKAVVVADLELTEEELEEDEDDAHETVTYDGKEYYLKLDDETIYDKTTQEYVGTWNAATKSVEFDTEEDEE
jgi:outer membrane biosynthesis protein TonB